MGMSVLYYTMPSIDGSMEFERSLGWIAMQIVHYKIYSNYFRNIKRTLHAFDTYIHKVLEMFKHFAKVLTAKYIESNVPSFTSYDSLSKIYK